MRLFSGGSSEQLEAEKDPNLWADVRRIARAKEEGETVNHDEVARLRWRLMIKLGFEGDGLDEIVTALSGEPKQEAVQRG